MVLGRIRVDISTAFLTADIPPEHLVLLKPPKSLIDLKLIKESRIWLTVRAVYGLRAASRLWEQNRDTKFATCEDKETYSLKQSKHRLPETSPDKRSDEQVSRWTEAKPVGVVGLHVDDTLAGSTKAICTEDPNTIRFLGLTLDYVDKKHSSDSLPEGSITINQLAYVVETLEKFETQFQLRMRTSAGDGDGFGKTAEPPPQAIKEFEHAVKNGLNLAGVAGSLIWLALRSRPC
eukprot:4390210-Amphidinium_carterae.1